MEMKTCLIRQSQKQIQAVEKIWNPSIKQSGQGHQGKGKNEQRRGESHEGNSGWISRSGEGPLKNDLIWTDTIVFPVLP